MSDQVQFTKQGGWHVSCLNVQTVILLLFLFQEVEVIDLTEVI